MHVVDHRSFKERQHKKAKSKRLGILAVTSSVTAVIILLFLVRFNRVSTPMQGEVSDAAVTSNDVNAAKIQKNPNGFYTGEQFQQLYESLAFPNTELLQEAPAITGDKRADARIRQIAESRGYVLRSVPIFPIIKTDEPRLTDDDLLQPKAYQAWRQLKKAAHADDIPLQLNSGYRSIESQRELFLGRLRAAGLSANAIASGSVDNAIVSVLTLAAPPGYSRHHTGYTIDLFCNDGTGRVFESTPCFAWLKADNYANAKSNGWVPSYPEGVNDQGPEPEPWEYVWVGVNTI